MIYRTIEYLSSREFFVASYCSVYLFFCELRIVRSIWTSYCLVYLGFVLFGLFGLRIVRSIWASYCSVYLDFVLLGLFAFCVMIYRSLFVLFHFSFDNFYCLSFFSFAASDYPFG